LRLGHAGSRRVEPVRDLLQRQASLHLHVEDRPSRHVPPFQTRPPLLEPPLDGLGCRRHGEETVVRAPHREVTEVGPVGADGVRRIAGPGACANGLLELCEASRSGVRGDWLELVRQAITL
jgi:hypothetical protein